VSVTDRCNAGGEPRPHDTHHNLHTHIARVRTRPGTDSEHRSNSVGGMTQSFEGGLSLSVRMVALCAEFDQ